MSTTVPASFKLVTRRVKTGEYKEDPDTLDIFIKDFALHSQVANNPKSLIQNGLKQLNGGKPKRSFVNGGLIAKDNGDIELGVHIDATELQAILKQANKNKLRIYFPADGASVFMGPDAVEKISSLQKKSIKK